MNKLILFAVIAVTVLVAGTLVSMSAETSLRIILIGFGAAAFVWAVNWIYLKLKREKPRERG